MKTNVYKIKDQEREWFLIDANGLVLGRISTIIADILRGKRKPTYTSNLDNGDNVIVVNAKKVILSKESKRSQKNYYRHSGYPGGLKKETFEEAIEKHPERVIELAVKGMMPKNKIAKEQLKRLKIYSDEAHPHTQKIVLLNSENNFGLKIGD